MESVQQTAEVSTDQAVNSGSNCQNDGSSNRKRVFANPPADDGLQHKHFKIVKGKDAYKWF